MMMLQERETRIGPTKGLGRCAARFDNEWFRAWIISDPREGFKVDVFYVDYGNMARVNKGETSLTLPDAWELPVNLYPFRLAENSDPVSKDMESKLVRLNVTRVGIDETGYLSEATLNEVLS
ncbi:hypothetical protein FSP39_003416 [Pinctada imbricata]|uniref:Tudor domain-containing protein n=1 Tax=Pinctada imbricata TaxID=66713 RepID=A0AA88Y1V9_PINIB|nr:hypothetical protein FSP39_003416 [Pinctada imbricata]